MNKAGKFPLLLHPYRLLNDSPCCGSEELARSALSIVINVCHVFILSSSPQQVVCMCTVGFFFEGLKKTRLFVKMHVSVKGDNVKEVEHVLRTAKACGCPEFLETGLNKEQIASRTALSPLQMVSPFILESSCEPEVKSQISSFKFGLPFKIFSHIQDEVR